ncbi:MAG: prepilin-type N-terminal cleavage/methylation domain-containing protein [gamma proteobacterium symbiont of Bathyaustriella thionipta]|nr:prepilin-type N-terminal cleavage/methylation domain-containing protein [gamma proteobacterium symbiont of Bathyaustriella thionipta]MCU7950425.1 prepilin-type N-terminal cleavage/methylation domain-containing protein [gamma proteobacterium symbiont of Bathyaustriella thionipta]MCU7953075.1 prepilin-type N-terminal cleavage/methylation domain-containing protein [gamma proteobacterium symbiont of Bathyaustriella thionipta]MCU7956931.1 prepilin-type N-terminal cleavage/methylation domain-contai
MAIRQTIIINKRHGFTLVELITVMLITGIIAMMVVNMITTPMESYGDMKRRAELVDIAEITLHRMARDIHRALPNSVRVPDAGRIEILHTIAGGRYTSSSFDTTQQTTSIELEKALSNEADINTTAGTVSCGSNGLVDCIVVYNLGQSGADAYEFDNMSAITGIAPGGTTINYNAIQFPYDSPNNRFMVINKAITFGCINGALYLKQDYAITNATPVIDVNNDSLLADNISACNFSYNPGTSTRPGLVTLQLSINDPQHLSEKVTLLHQIFVENQP